MHLNSNKGPVHLFLRGKLVPTSSNLRFTPCVKGKSTVTKTIQIDLQLNND